MSHTITAIFQSGDVADLVRQKITTLGVSDRHIHVVGGADRAGEIDSLHLPYDEADTYRQAVQQGHYVVSAELEDDMIDAAAEAMRHPEEGVDIDAYEEDYRASPAYDAGAAGTVDADGAATAEGTSIPIAEERLVVGKRAVQGGSAHVRTYVQEVPVEERVRLREERLLVERRPVERVVTGADSDALFQERDIEVATRSEEAVVSKEAVVTEEIVVGKEVTEHEEVVRETVRRTEVEIDDDTDRN